MKRMCIPILPALALCLWIGVRRFPRVALLLADCVAPPLAALLGRFSTRFPFPIAGLFCVFCFAAITVFLFVSIRQRRTPRAASGFISAILIAYILLWDVCYTLPSTPAEGLPVTALSTLCERLIEETESALPAFLERDESDLLIRSLTLMCDQTRLPLVPAKWTRFPALFSALGIAGLYFPFTGEAIVNGDDLPDTLPFTICHELAHQAGFAREEAANYCAFLACETGADALFQYSSRFTMLLYAMKALHGADPHAWNRYVDSMSGQLFARFVRCNGLMLSQPDRTKSIQRVVTDVFLRFSGERDGVGSYDRVISLIAAHWGLLDSAI